GAGARAEVMEGDIASLIKELEGIGVLRPKGFVRHRSSPATSEDYNVAAKGPARQYRGSIIRDHRSEDSYQLVDFRFRLRTPAGSIECEAARLFSHLHLSETNSSGVVVEVVEDGNEWLLLYDDEVVDRCSSAGAVIPMVHANVLLTAYRTSSCMAALHAAAVIRNG